MKNNAIKMGRRYLEQYRKAEILTRQKELELENLRAQAEYHGQAEGERVQSSAAGDTLAVYVARIIEAESSLLAAREHLLMLRTEIVSGIQALRDARYCDLLYRRYVECKSYRQIAHEMQYSPEYVRNHLLPAALQAMGEYLHNQKMLHNVAF